MMSHSQSRGIDVVSKLKDRIAKGRFEPLSSDEEFVAAIWDNNPDRASRLLRELDTLGRYALDALADMIDGGNSNQSSQKPHHPVVLKISSASGPGRPRKRDARSVVSPQHNERKMPVKSRSWEPMMALRVQRLTNEGRTRTQAIEEARHFDPFAKESKKKTVPPSFSAVEKAYDCYQKKGRSKRAKPVRRVLK